MRQIYQFLQPRKLISFEVFSIFKTIERLPLISFKLWLTFPLSQSISVLFCLCLYLWLRDKLWNWHTQKWSQLSNEWIQYNLFRANFFEIFPVFPKSSYFPKSFTFTVRVTFSILDAYKYTAHLARPIWLVVLWARPTLKFEKSK